MLKRTKVQVTGISQFFYVTTWILSEKTVNDKLKHTAYPYDKQN